MSRQHLHEHDRFGAAVAKIVDEQDPGMLDAVAKHDRAEIVILGDEDAGSDVRLREKRRVSGVEARSAA